MNIFRRTVPLLMCIGTIVIGLLFAGIGIYSLNAPQPDYLETQGTIVDIQESLSAIDDSTEYTVYIDYQVDGKTYSHMQYGSYSSSMKVGDRVTVLYDPARPDFIQAPGGEAIPYVFVGVGLLCAAFGVFSLIRRFRSVV